MFLLFVVVVVVVVVVVAAVLLLLLFFGVGFIAVSTLDLQCKYRSVSGPEVPDRHNLSHGKILCVLYMVHIILYFERE